MQRAPRARRCPACGRARRARGRALRGCRGRGSPRRAGRAVERAGDPAARRPRARRSPGRPLRAAPAAARSRCELRGRRCAVRDTSVSPWRSRASESRTARSARAERRPLQQLPARRLQARREAPSAGGSAHGGAGDRRPDPKRSTDPRAAGDDRYGRAAPTRRGHAPSASGSPRPPRPRGRAYTLIERPATGLAAARERGSAHHEAPRQVRRGGRRRASGGMGDCVRPLFGAQGRRAGRVDHERDQPGTQRAQGAGRGPGQHLVILPSVDRRASHRQDRRRLARIRDSCVTVLSTTRCGTSRWRPPRCSPTT